MKLKTRGRPQSARRHPMLAKNSVSWGFHVVCSMSPGNRTICIQHGQRLSPRAADWLSIAQRVNKENSMQAVAPFVAMIVVLAVVFYLAHWDANRVKIKRWSSP